MIKITSDDLRYIADMIDCRSVYDNMCGAVYLSIEKQSNGKSVAVFEQPCVYKECNSYFYRIGEDDAQ